MEFMGIASFVCITIICHLIGTGVKATSVDNKYIPLICGICGMILGMVALWSGVPDFPAHDYMTAAAVGIVSGLAATGADQTFKQLM